MNKIRSSYLRDDKCELDQTARWVTSSSRVGWRRFMVTQNRIYDELSVRSVCVVRHIVPGGLV